MLRRVALVKPDVSEERSASIIREALGSSETLVLRRATGRNIPEDDILHGYCRVNLKSSIPLRTFLPDSHTDKGFTAHNPTDPGTRMVVLLYYCTIVLL
jgi:hypothetical protein